MVGDLAPYLDAGARASYPMVLNQIRLGRLVHVVGIRSIRTRKRGGDLLADSGNSCSSLVVTKTIVFNTASDRLSHRPLQPSAAYVFHPLRVTPSSLRITPYLCSVMPDELPEQPAHDPHPM